MKKLIKQFLQIGCVLFLVCALAPAIAFGQVTVFAEGAYTETDLAVYIYANTNGTELRSAGVKLIYEPSALTVTSAEKNEAVWYLGSETYMDPETATAGEVVIILGKLDTEATSVGVSGDRVLLGKVRFTHGGLMSFTLNLDYGKRGPANEFKNFVATDQTVLDDSAVTFGTITVKERGDANGDGGVDIRDIRSLRQKIGVPDNPCWVDCNGDESVDIRDVRCLRQKI